MKLLLDLRKSITAIISVTILLLTVSCKHANNTRVLTDVNGEIISQVELYFDTDENAIVFAAEDLKKILESMDVTVSVKPLSRLKDNPKGIYFVIAENSDYIQSCLSVEGGMSTDEMGEQEYALRASLGGYWAIGGDRVGTMYGGIHIGELIKGGSLAKFKNENKSPYITKRGLKYNVPLDSRTPSFDDRGASANTNRKNVWDINFWKEYFDVLARQRYNVLSVWNRHPFPSIVKVPGYEDIALDDVYAGDEKLIDISIEEKIKFWNEVLELAYDRGIEVWFVVWNVELYGIGPNGEEEDNRYGETNNKYGITKDKNNRTTVDYIKKSVIQYFLSYPRMAGIGITAGEKMHRFTKDEKEQWVWDAYGEAVMEVKKLQPDRKIRFVHRHWLTDWDQIESRFGQLPDGFEIALKYAQARLYSSTHPSYAAEKLNKIPTDMPVWWNLRNDDIFIQRWGDPEYVKEYILNFPHRSKPCDQSPCLTAGYVMGSDRYFWGRESMSKNPQSPRQLENEKHWYKFLLWGRLGYDPNTPTDLLKGLIAYRFNTTNESNIYDSWQTASKIIPMVNRFHFWPWDYMWWVEKGIGNLSMGSVDGFHDINQVIRNKTQNVSAYTSILDYMSADGALGVADSLDALGYTNIKDYLEGGSTDTSMPLWVADKLEDYANQALKGIEGISDGGNIELRETLSDIRSQAYFGIYWANRIRGGFELELFRRSYNEEHRELAIPYLEGAVDAWKKYAAQLDASYEKVEFAAHGVFDWDEMTSYVESDITITKKANWALLYIDQLRLCQK